MNKDLRVLFEQECAVIFIDGKKRSGKTNLGLRLLEDAGQEGLIDKMATNINTQKEGIEQICYLDDLNKWLEGKGRKGFLLDELGKHLSRVRFMTELSKTLFDVIQLVGHFDCYFIGCCPTEGLIDKLFLNTDILDCKIHKRGRIKARVINYITGERYTMRDIPATSIPYNSKDIASFGTTNPKKSLEEFDKLPRCCQCANLYLVLRSYRKVAERMNCTFQNVGQLMDAHIKHQGLTRLKMSP